jgi:hypothetical protein
MADTETTLSALERNWEMVTKAVSDVDEATMSRSPNKESNSISWLLWHMSRVADRFIHTRLQGTQQLWEKDRWYEKFGMASDPSDFGMGWSSDQVQAWKAPPKQVQLSYYHAVNAAARSYLQGLTPEDLKRQIPFPALPNTGLPNTLSVGNVLGILVWDNIVHGGQIAYLRGYYRGMGWHR